MGQQILNSSQRPHNSESSSGDLVKLNYLLDHGYDLSQAIELYHRITFFEGMTLADVAEQMISEGRFGSVPEKLRHLVNVENIVRHLRARGYTESAEGVFVMDEPRRNPSPTPQYIVFD